MNKKIVSGMRPTGRLHLGNYWGALKNWVELQDKYNCMFFVADWHALTTGYENTSEIKENTLQMVIDWLAAGLDPKKSVIFRQSDISEIAELNLLLGMITPLGGLLRNPTYKEQLTELYQKRYAGQDKEKKSGKNIKILAEAAEISDEKQISAVSEISSFGFLGYPVLMSSDILIHKGEFVPVGKDQLAHLESSRDIARRFSGLYGENILIEPKPLLTQTPLVPGLDGKKMSKSYGNTIEIGEDLESVQKKVMQMFTDPKKLRANDKGNPEGCVVFAFHKIYNSEYKKRETQCRQGSIGCVACKKELFGFMKPQIESFRKKRVEFENNPQAVWDILCDGGKKAKESAKKTISSVRKAMRLV